jgi:hypothetical protein
MSGNMTEAQGIEWLTRYRAALCGYPMVEGAAYLGLDVKRFRYDVASARLHNPISTESRLLWAKAALDRHLDKVTSNAMPPAAPAH